MISYKKVFGLSLIFFVLLLNGQMGCQSQHKADNVLSKELLIQILIDMHRAEALVIEHRNQIAHDSALLLQRMLEEEVYRSYGITDSLYIHSLNYYAQQDGVIDKIYQQVVDSLEK